MSSRKKSKNLETISRLSKTATQISRTNWPNSKNQNNQKKPYWKKRKTSNGRSKSSSPYTEHKRQRKLKTGEGKSTKFKNPTKNSWTRTICTSFNSKNTKVSSTWKRTHSWKKSKYFRINLSGTEIPLNCKEHPAKADSITPKGQISVSIQLEVGSSDPSMIVEILKFQNTDLNLKSSINFLIW